MCNCPRRLREGSNFLGLCLGSSGYRQCLWSDAWRNNLVSASRARSSIWKTSEHSPRLKALRKSPSSRSLSPLDNCPEKAGRAYVTKLTTDKTIAVNTMCRASRERPWHFNCCNRYNRWFGTDKICSTCTEVEKVAVICIPKNLVTVSCSMKDRGWGVRKFRAEGRLKTIYFVFWD